MVTLNFNFAKKVVLIIGGCSGLGEALTVQFNQAGATVYSTSRDISKYQNNSNFKAKNIYLRNLEVTKEQEIKELCNLIIQEQDKIDILIYSATHRVTSKYIMELECQDWLDNLSVDVIGAFLSLKVISEIMKKQNQGRIITIGSMYATNAIDFSIYPEGRRPSPVNYAVAKAGVVHLTKCFAVEYAHFGVTINCVSPGGILKAQEKEFLKQYNKKAPIGRMANLKEVVDAVMFLASDEASYITGHNLLIDGGWSCW